MPNWYKGQHGRVSKVLEHPFADVLYPAPAVAQRAVHFVAKPEMVVSHTRSQLSRLLPSVSQAKISMTANPPSIPF